MLRRAVATFVLAAVCVAAAVALGSPSSLGAEPGRASAGDGSNVPTPGPGSTVEIAPGYSPSGAVRTIGPLPNSTVLNVAVGLSMNDPSGLAAVLDLIDTPGTSLYRHFLGPEALADDYGASVATVRQARSYFQGFGLSARVSSDRLLLSVQGPAGSVGAAFHTQFEEYDGPQGLFVSHPTPATLPAGIPWTGALGLGNVTSVEPDVTAGPAAAPSAGCSGSTTYAPCQIQAAYNVSSLLADGTNGSGETIAVVDTYDGSEPQSRLASDLAEFDDDFGLAAPTVNYLYPVPTTADLNASDTGWGVEEALDLEWSHALAPGATIDMTFSPNSGAGLYEAVDYLVANDLVNVVSLSWGEPDVGVFNAYEGPCAYACNASTDGSYAILGPVLEFAAAEGISVFAATGDCGSADGTSGLATNFPASDPYVTAVGGTLLTAESDGEWRAESAWSGNASGATSPGCHNQGGSGGGYSPFLRPYWQVGEGIGVGSADARRGTPDVAAIASPGVEIIESGSLAGVGGTSVATPIWAGLAADADQYAGVSLGFLDPTLYGLLGSGAYASDFHDIVSGNNGAYSAGAGWDPVTGLGSPIASALLPDLAASPPVPTAVLANLSASTESGPAPLTVTFSVSAVGGSPYDWEGVYFGDGNASFAVNGSARHTYSTPGVYTAQAYLADASGNLTISAPVSILVGDGQVLAVNLTANRTAALGSRVQFETTVTGGTAPLSYSYFFGDGTYLLDASSPLTAHTYRIAGSYCAVVVVQDAADPPDGGQSMPAAIGVGGDPVPTCAPTPLTVTPVANPAVRDAPADFGPLFTIAGGSGTISEHVVSSDPYVAACDCTIFRAPGTYLVRDYVNDTAGAHWVNETNVTVAPRLVATFAANVTGGVSPLSILFSADVTGGTGADTISWTFGDGTTGAGSPVETTYDAPGLYWAVGHVRDAGYGNASEAILIDVLAAGAGDTYLAATIGPVVDVPSASTVNFSAAVVADGASVPANVSWTLAGASLADTAAARRTVYAPATDPGAAALTGEVVATLASTGATLPAPFSLGPLFAVADDGSVPAADALVLADTGGPANGTAPLAWSGAARAAGPGTIDLTWTFGDGGEATGANVSHSYAAGGNFTATVTAVDSWGDVAVDEHGVDAASPPVPVLRLSGGLSTDRGTAPLTVTFNATATGGTPPYAFGWAFGDGGTAAVGNTTHTYDHAGNFTANVTVRDSAGATVTDSYLVDVLAGPTGPAAAPFPWAVAIGVGAAGAAIVVAAVVVRRRDRRPPPTP